MPVKACLLASASLLLVSLTATNAQVAAPNFGTGALAAPAAVAPAAGGVRPPSFAPAPIAAASPAAPAAGGANPFAAVQPPEAPAQAPTAAFQIAPAAAAANEPDAPSGPDDAALRYYAAQRDMARVGAEIRRLKALYPTWAPPEDLFSAGPKVSEQPIWDLFATGDYAGAAAMVEKLKGDNAGWQPTADLGEKLADATARSSIAAAAANGSWPAVVKAAQSRPSLLTCDNVDLMWNLGEALVRTGDLARAYDAYAYVLSQCQDGGQRLATVQKASALLPPAGADALIALGRTGADGRSEFATLRFDPLRAEMGRVASGLASNLPADADLARFAEFVGRERSAGDAQLFGWYYYGQKKWAEAADWFRAAAQIDSSPKNVEGVVLSLRQAGDLDAAGKLAYDNRDRAPEIEKIYIELVSERLSSGASDTLPGADEVRRFADVVDASRSALGAQSLGWYWIGQEKVETAKAWFEKSVGWDESSQGVIGLAVASARLKDTAGLKAVKARYGERYPELAEFQTASAASAPRAKARPVTVRKGGGGGQDAALREAQKQFDAGDYKAALATLDKRQAAKGYDRGAELLRGWTNLKMRRFSEARQIFKAEDKKGSTKDTRFGIGATFNSQFNAW
ncbi:hypothetical protein ACLNGM_05990 [Aureimonas phyllosphaerae]|uniref:hypothetical protein n=1 Tax=Aureimonas phyllosphaerae TaxID=1166078 RepID=UPI003A5BAC5C